MYRPDFETIRHLSLSIVPSYIWGGGPDPLNFHMELDAIRIGALPVLEPSSGVLVTLYIGIIRVCSIITGDLGSLWHASRV